MLIPAITADHASRSTWREFLDAAVLIAKGICAFLIAGLVIFFVFACYMAYRQSGWQTHQQDTSIYFQHEWMVGEYRTCTMWQHDVWDNTVIPAASRTLDCQSDTDAPSFTTHIFPVLYYGRIDRSDKAEIQWKCQRKEESLTCYSQN